MRARDPSAHHSGDPPKRKPRTGGAFEVDLVQSLSHVRLSQNLEGLSARDWKTLPPSSKKTLQKTTTKRGFGEVGDAIVQVLGEAARDLRMIEIHVAVEELLGEPVSRSSVKNYLARGSDQ